jgi:CheY-like chemotaxis protein
MSMPYLPDAPRRTARVLVVDDDAAIRTAVTMLLEDEGYQVLTAANGREALAHVVDGAERPDVILLDLQMPIMSGWDVLAHLRAAHVEIPVVFMTAGYRARAEAARHGADGFLAKPFAIDDVLALVARLTAAPPA